MRSPERGERPSHSATPFRGGPVVRSHVLRARTAGMARTVWLLGLKICHVLGMQGGIAGRGGSARANWVYSIFASASDACGCMRQLGARLGFGMQNAGIVLGQNHQNAGVHNSSRVHSSTYCSALDPV